MIRKLLSLFKKGKLKAKIIPRSQHIVSRDLIDDNALKVLYRLRKAGFAAFLVGGSIRDCLLGVQPKDFDVATDADPDQIRKLFSNCRLIGRRFRLAHIHFGREIIEVATFRAHHATQTAHADHGMILRDNVYGTIEEDVLRRDFTINALYYNIADFSIADFVGGMDDLQARSVALIGDPELRYREDPVRMLRAVRFAAKLDFTIDPDTAAPIKELGNLLANIPPARIFEEFSKLFLLGKSFATYKMLCKYDLFTHLFPLLIKHTDNNIFIETALQSTDARVASGKSVSPSFLLAVLGWQSLLEQLDNFRDLPDAMDTLLRQQQRIMAVPRRIGAMVRDVWQFQWRFERKRTQKSIESMYTSPKFRAAYDFLLLRAQTGDALVTTTAKWWQNFVESDDAGREKILISIKKSPRKKTKQSTS